MAALQIKRKSDCRAATPGEIVKLDRRDLPKQKVGGAGDGIGRACPEKAGVE